MMTPPQLFGFCVLQFIGSVMLLLSARGLWRERWRIAALAFAAALLFTFAARFVPMGNKY